VHYLSFCFLAASVSGRRFGCYQVCKYTDFFRYGKRLRSMPGRKADKKMLKCDWRPFTLQKAANRTLKGRLLEGKRRPFTTTPATWHNIAGGGALYE